MIYRFHQSSVFCRFQKFLVCLIARNLVIKLDWLIDCFVFYAVSAKFQPRTCTCVTANNNLKLESFSSNEKVIYYHQSGYFILGSFVCVWGGGGYFFLWGHSIPGYFFLGKMFNPVGWGWGGGSTTHGHSLEAGELNTRCNKNFYIVCKSWCSKMNDNISRVLCLIIHLIRYRP